MDMFQNRHNQCCRTIVLSTSLRKTFFAWRFILNENVMFWLNISYQKPFVFSVSEFYSQIFTLKLNLWPKIGLTYTIFWNFCLRKYYLLFFAKFELLRYHNNIVKISEKLNKRNLLKICIHFYYGKKLKYSIFSKPKTRVNNFCIDSYDRIMTKDCQLTYLHKALSKTWLSERCRKHRSKELRCLNIYGKYSSTVWWWFVFYIPFNIIYRNNPKYWDTLSTLPYLS